MNFMIYSPELEESNCRDQTLDGLEVEPVGPATFAGRHRLPSVRTSAGPPIRCTQIGNLAIPQKNLQKIKRYYNYKFLKKNHLLCFC